MEFSTLKFWTCLFVLFVFASLNVTAVEKAGIEPAIADVIVNNTYVEIAVDDSDSNYRSTFTMGTTGGDPSNANDDDKVLLYGHPYPWSSLTTIRVDGTDYIYGGTGMSMVTGATASTDSITSTWAVGDIIVTQTLTIVTSSTTGRADTVKIDHKITNNGSNSVR